MNHDARYYMRAALRLAGKGGGLTSPNPMVGAVVVRDGMIVGKGYHEYVGGPHAEVNALRAAADSAAGATLYVTLEPCNHFGRTPPCTQAILAAGVSRVVIGMADPNAHVKGGGADYLRARGVNVELGVLEHECRLLNQGFIKHVTTGLPHVTLKAAMTLDGRIATRKGDSKWISNELSRRFVHDLRCRLDAVLVGIGTVLADDPLLTARVGKRTRCRQPTRIVLDSDLQIPVHSRLVQTARDCPLCIACSEQAAADRVETLERKGAKVLCLPSANGRVDLPALLLELGKLPLTSLLVEGGSRVLGEFIEQGLADDFYFFYAPKILADPEGLPSFSGKVREYMSEAIAVHALKVRRFGKDVMLCGRIRKDIY